MELNPFAAPDTLDPDELRRRLFAGQPAADIPGLQAVPAPAAPRVIKTAGDLQPVGWPARRLATAPAPAAPAAMPAQAVGYDVFAGMLSTGGGASTPAASAPVRDALDFAPPAAKPPLVSRPIRTAGAPASKAAPAAAQPPNAPEDTEFAALASAATAGGVQGDGDEEQARQQELRNERATNKYLRSTGAQMEVTPTGQTRPQTDAEGNPIYRSQTLQPITRLDDGRTYRVTRSPAGTQQYFDIERDGKEGADYHVDPHTGEKYVLASHPDGGSRREVIGQDAFVPAIAAARERMQAHQFDHEQATIAIDRAEQGAAGAPGLGSLPLTELRERHSALSQSLAPARQTLDEIGQHVRGGRALNAQQIDAQRRAIALVNQYGPTAQALEAEVSNRESVVSQTRQQRTDAMDARREAILTRNRIAAGRGQENAPVLQDLADALDGQPVNGPWAKRYASVGLLSPEQQPDGSVVHRVTAAGLALLPRRVQQMIAENPEAYNLTPDAIPAPTANSRAQSGVSPTYGQPRQAAAQDQPFVVDDDDGAGQQAAAQRVPAVSPSAPSQQQAVQSFQEGDAPYKVDDQGQVSFDPNRLTDGLLAANRAGLIPDDKLKEILPRAIDAEKAAKAQQAGVAAIQAKEASAGSFAGAKAAAFGAAKGAGFLASAAPGAAIGAEVGALGGPLAPFTVPAGSIIGGLITGTLGSMAVEHGVKELAKHSDTLKSFADASELHPYYDAAGNLVSFAAGLPKAATGAAAAGIRALAGEGEGVAARVARGAAQHYENSGGLADTVKNLQADAANRVASGASAGQAATAVAARVVGKAGGMVAIDTAIKEGAHALGINDDLLCPWEHSSKRTPSRRWAIASTGRLAPSGSKLSPPPA